MADRLKSLEQATAYQGNIIQHSNVSKSLKSGRFRGAEAQVIRNIPWPHKLCYVGAARKTVTYDDITPLQFTVGFLKSVQLEHSQDTREAMLDYFIKLALGWYRRWVEYRSWGERSHLFNTQTRTSGLVPEW